MSAKTRDRAQRRRAAREQAQRRERAQLRAAELEVLARRRRLEEEAKRKRESFPRRLLLSNALVEAYRDGQMTELKDMLDDDEPNHLNELMADPYERDEFEPHHKEEECDATMLFDACYGGHVNVARLLLEYGAEVDAVSWIYPCEQGPRGAHIYTTWRK